jgi:hypothetical protein
MKNDFDLKGYMKSNKLGAYQQLNEMWYSDLQALGQPMGMRHTAINEEEAVEEQEIEEGKKQLAFVIPCPDCYDIDEEAEHFQYLLDKAGVKAKVKANQVGEEAEVYTKDEKKARKVIEKNGYQIGWNEDHEDNGQGEPTQSDDQEQSHYLDIPTGPDKGWKNEEELEEKGDVKSIGDAGKMAHANTRTNLGRHRSSDMLDKMSKKDHKTNTIVGAKATAYKAPHMKEEEEDIFAGSDDADWTDNYGNDTSEWDTEIAGQTVKGWTAEETQGGAIAWQNPRYPNAHIYATPGWEGVDGIAFELHDSEDGYMDEPKIQKVVGAGTDLWKTKAGYMALMAKAFTVAEKMLTPSDNMDEDYMGTQYGSSEDMAVDMLKKGITEDEDPFGSIKTGIDKITQGDDEDFIDDDKLDRFYEMGGRQLTKAADTLLDDGFSKREIIDYLQNYM